MSTYPFFSPIGVIDSGIGGISIAKALMETTTEDVLYFADTEHMPYGKRSLSEIRRYTTQGIEFLASQNCKFIIIACNTATCAVNDLLPELNKRITVYNVIDPVVNYVSEHYENRKVGLICTELTHKLGVFEKKLEERNRSLRLISFKATQLASLIELEFENSAKLKQLIKEYFAHHQFKNIEAFILGCTHYLWLKEDFLQLNPFVDWIEPTTLIAQQIKEKLEATGTAKKGHSPPKAIFCQTGRNPEFFKLANRLTPSNYRKYFYEFEWADQTLHPLSNDNYCDLMVSNLHLSG